MPNFIIRRVVTTRQTTVDFPNGVERRRTNDHYKVTAEITDVEPVEDNFMRARPRQVLPQVISVDYFREGDDTEWSNYGPAVRGVCLKANGEPGKQETTLHFATGTEGWVSEFVRDNAPPADWHP